MGRVAGVTATRNPLAVTVKQKVGKSKEEETGKVHVHRDLAIIQIHHRRRQQHFSIRETNFYQAL